jgi:hypothetical protein
MNTASVRGDALDAANGQEKNWLSTTTIIPYTSSALALSAATLLGDALYKRAAPFVHQEGKLRLNVLDTVKRPVI